VLERHLYSKDHLKDSQTLGRPYLRGLWCMFFCGGGDPYIGTKPFTSPSVSNMGLKDDVPRSNDNELCDLAQ
jgi:hypothetical protein